MPSCQARNEILSSLPAYNTSYGVGRLQKKPSTHHRTCSGICRKSYHISISDYENVIKRLKAEICNHEWERYFRGIGVRNFLYRVIAMLDIYRSYLTSKWSFAHVLYLWSIPQITFSRSNRNLNVAKTLITTKPALHLSLNTIIVKPELQCLSNLQ